MNGNDFLGHGFLPPSIRVPSPWLPSHGIASGVPVAAVAPTSAGSILQLLPTEDMRRSLTLAQT